jgi:DNA-directed RNA polymerase specialized sigma24 family protein
MTREQYGLAYEEGHEHTVRFLLSRGVNRETARDVAQSAWLRGWERLDQLRDERILITWVNAIALNQFRKALRRDRRHQALQDSPHWKPFMNWAALDLMRILSRCRTGDRALLKAQLEGVTAKELSEQTGASATAMRIRFLRARSAARAIGLGPASATTSNGSPKLAAAV